MVSHSVPPILVLTFDTDWAPPFMLQEVLDLLGDAPATFFVTDEAAVDCLRDHQNIELGIHPNFMPGSTHGSDRRQVLETLLGWVPDARSVRAHNLFQDTTVLNMYLDYGLQFDLTLLEYKNPNIRLFRYWNDLVRIPYNFEDDIACLRGEVDDWNRSYRTFPVLICDFHPVHVCLNSDTYERYVTLRSRLMLHEVTPCDVAPFTNLSTRGVRDILCELLSAISKGELIVADLDSLTKSVGISNWT